MQITLAMWHDWPPQISNHIAPAFYEELVQRHNAEARYMEWKSKQTKPRY